MLTFEMNMDMKIVQREGYNFLDVFSDVGGVSAILFSFIAFLLNIWNYRYFDSYMVSKLYTVLNTSF